MNFKALIIILMAGLATAGTVCAQEKRGNTDYTNNRTRGKGKPDRNVNTEKSSPVKFIQYLPGRWEVQQVLRGKKDITETDTLVKNQVIEFNREGRYMSYSGREMIDSGAYRLNEQHAVLYLDSDLNDTTSEWSIWFTPDGVMTLQLRDGVRHGERFRYVYKRQGTTTSDRQRDEE